MKSEIAESLAQRSIIVDSDFASADGAVLDEQRVDQLRELEHVVSVEPTLRLPVSITVAGEPVLFNMSSFRPSFPPPLVVPDQAPTSLASDEVLLPRTIGTTSLESLWGTEIEIEHDAYLEPGVSTSVRSRVKVVGITDPAWQQDTTTPAYASGETIHSWYEQASADGVAENVATEGYQEATVVVSTAGQVRPVLEAAQAMGLTATATKELTPQLPDQLQIIKTLTRIVLVGLTLLALVATSVLVRGLVLQRTREIGLLMSLGYRGAVVWLVMLLEVVLVAWAGLVGGLLVATAAANIGTGFVPESAMPGLFVGEILFPRADLVFSSLVVVSVVVVLGSILPLSRASRLEPAAALRDTL